MRCLRGVCPSRAANDRLSRCKVPRGSPGSRSPGCPLSHPRPSSLRALPARRRTVIGRNIPGQFTREHGGGRRGVLEGIPWSLSPPRAGNTLTLGHRKTLEKAYQRPDGVEDTSITGQGWSGGTDGPGEWYETICGYGRGLPPNRLMTNSTRCRRLHDIQGGCCGQSPDAGERYKRYSRPYQPIRRAFEGNPVWIRGSTEKGHDFDTFHTKSHTHTSFLTLSPFK